MSWLGRLLRALYVIARQPARNPKRTVLTFLGLVTSFFLYAMLQSVLATLDLILSKSASETILVTVARNERGLLFAELPRSYAAQLRETEGVAASAPVRFFVGVGRTTKAVFALGTDVEDFMSVHGLDVPREALERMQRERRAAIAGTAVLAANGWSVGDRLILSTAGVGPSMPVEVVAELPGETRFQNMILVDIDYMEDVLGDAGRVAFFQTRIQKPDFAASLSRLIDARLENYSVPTQTRSEEAHMAGVFSNLRDAFRGLQVIGFLTLGVTVLVVANSVSMSVRERTVEIGTLRALGFSKLWIFSMIVGESVLIAVAGGLVGALLAVGVATGLAQSGYTQMGEVRFDLVLDAKVFFQVVALSIPVGALAAAQPVTNAIRMPIAIALRFAA